MRVLLERCVVILLNFKLVVVYKDFFFKMVVDVVMFLDDFFLLNMIGMKKVKGGVLEDLRFIFGVVFKKTFFYVGFEM